MARRVWVWRKELLSSALLAKFSYSLRWWQLFLLDPQTFFLLECKFVPFKPPLPLFLTSEPLAATFLPCFRSSYICVFICGSSLSWPGVYIKWTQFKVETQFRSSRDPVWLSPFCLLGFLSLYSFFNLNFWPYGISLLSLPFHFASICFFCMLPSSFLFLLLLGTNSVAT